MTGLLVDAVSDIIALSSNDLQSPPDTQSDQSSGVVSALTLIEERMIKVLNLDAIVNASESMAAFRRAPQCVRSVAQPPLKLCTGHISCAGRRIHKT